MPKDNPFLKPKKKDNPFIAKAKAKAAAAAKKDPLAKAREAKAAKKAAEEAARPEKERQEIADLQAKLVKTERWYEQEFEKESKLFAKLDRLKDKDSERYHATYRAWDASSRKCQIWMGQVLKLSAALRTRGVA